MQIDMHYYGVYCLLRAAGFREDIAQIIATASQFVDEAVVRNKDPELLNGSIVSRTVSAHHCKDIQNLERSDQRRVWIPFHFLPGGLGSTLSEKLVCVKNSEIAKKMVKNAINQHNKYYFPELLGVTAHVYADTFAHYGFSGTSSRMNKIKNDTMYIDLKNQSIKKYIEEKKRKFLKKYNIIFPNIKSFVVEEITGALGHGAVITNPDRPYLKWGFEYEEPRINELNMGNRNNQVTFLEGTEALFKMFKNALQIRDDLKDNKSTVLSYNEIKDSVKSIISFEGTKIERAARWKNAMNNGEIISWAKEEIPEPLSEDWNNEIEQLNGIYKDIEITSLHPYRFYKAAYYHRNFILDELLPSEGIFVV